MRAERAIEVGNIFRLGTRFSEAFNFTYRDAQGKSQFVVMGSYGIGLGRVMGAIVEVHHDRHGMILPAEAAPFPAHLLALSDQAPSNAAAKRCAADLQKAGIEVLYDDRQDVSAGEKLAEADLIGLPARIIVSERTVRDKLAEVKSRNQEKSVMIPLAKIADYFTKN